MKMKSQTQPCGTLLWVLLFLMSVAKLTTASKILTGSFRVQQTNGEDFSFDVARRNIRSTEIGKTVKEESVEFGVSNAALGELLANEASKGCNLTKDLLTKMYSKQKSMWIVDNISLFLMGNDLQPLIQCTQSGDIIVFMNVSAVGLIKPAVIPHNLTLRGGNNSGSKTVGCHFPFVTFTCPYNNPLIHVLSSGHLTLINIKIKDCKPSSASWSVVNLQKNATGKFYHVVFEDNLIRPIYALDNSKVIVFRSAFSRNTVSGNGGSIYIGSRGYLQTTWSIFRVSGGSYGGALFAGTAAAMYVSNSEFSGNYGSFGGSIFVDDKGSASIWNSRFLGNGAKFDGGAMYCRQENQINIAKSIFIGNMGGASYKGGGIYIEKGDKAVVSASTFIGNFAQYGGAIAFGPKGNTTISGCTFIGNRVTKACPDVYPC